MANTETADGAAVRSAPKGRGLNIGLWVAQGALALAFGAAGVTHATMPIHEMARTMAWAGSAPAGLVRFIGTAELAGAVGLLLPGLTRIKPILTAWAAAGLLAIMVLASFMHVARGEVGALPVTGVLGSIAAFVTWGRFRKAPIAPRA